MTTKNRAKGSTTTRDEVGALRRRRRQPERGRASPHPDWINLSDDERAAVLFAEASKYVDSFERPNPQPARVTEIAWGNHRLFCRDRTKTESMEYAKQADQCEEARYLANELASAVRARRDQQDDDRRLTYLPAIPDRSEYIQRINLLRLKLQNTIDKCLAWRGAGMGPATLVDMLELSLEDFTCGPPLDIPGPEAERLVILSDRYERLRRLFADLAEEPPAQGHANQPTRRLLERLEELELTEPELAKTKREIATILAVTFNLTPVQGRPDRLLKFANLPNQPRNEEEDKREQRIARNCWLAHFQSVKGSIKRRPQK